MMFAVMMQKLMCHMIMPQHKQKHPLVLQLTHPSWQAQTAQTEALSSFEVDAPELASANSTNRSTLWFCN
jgi:hypothetical protein